MDCTTDHVLSVSLTISVSYRYQLAEFQQVWQVQHLDLKNLQVQTEAVCVLT